MSEHWKSTPNYWCKYCATYVRDSKLERTNHELTGKHQGAVRRALANIHRAANTQERERERARREIDRLNGVVVAVASNSNSNYNNNNNSNNNNNNNTAAAAATPKATASSAAAERQRQAEQLAALGVALPQAFRGDLAMPGEWSVTSTTAVVKTAAAAAAAGGGGLKAKGVHKRVRERTEEEEEDKDKDKDKEHEEEAVDVLTKKRRRRWWGRDGAAHTGGEELDALLSGGLGLGVAGEKKQEERPAQAQAEDGALKKKEEEEEEEEEGDQLAVKKEPSVEPDVGGGIPADLPDAGGVDKLEEPSIKTEDGQAASEEGAVDIPAVAFKKRKPKNIRQRR